MMAKAMSWAAAVVRNMRIFIYLKSYIDRNDQGYKIWLLQAPTKKEKKTENR